MSIIVGVENMGRDMTYLDLMDAIKAERGDTPDSKKQIKKYLDEISSKYGVGAAQKAYDSCKLEGLGIEKPT